jgi:cytochrome c5
MLKPFLLISALVMLSAITPGSGATPPAGGAGQDAATPKPSAAALDKARKTYAVDCTICHGDNGNGKTDFAKDMALNLEDWTNPATLASKSDKQLFDIIRNGKDKMPSEPVGRASDNEVRAFVYYIRNFSKGQAAPTDPAPAAPVDTTPAAPAGTPAAPAADKPSN